MIGRGDEDPTRAGAKKPSLGKFLLEEYRILVSVARVRLEDQLLARHP